MNKGIFLIHEAKRIIDAANLVGLRLRAFGRIGVAISCGLQDINTRDIDLFGQKIKEDVLIHFFEKQGFKYEYPFPGMFIFQKKIKNDFLLKVDVYIKELKFAFKIPGPFSPSDQYTIPITQLFLSKLYFSDDDWSVKEQEDLKNILRTHQLCFEYSNRKCRNITKNISFQFIQLKILQKTWCGNPESYANFSFCEKKLETLLQDINSDSVVKEKIEYILEFIRRSPKNCPYKVGKCLHIGSPNIVEDAS
jgi:hypothetical protein